MKRTNLSLVPLLLGALLGVAGLTMVSGCQGGAAGSLQLGGKTETPPPAPKDTDGDGVNDDLDKCADKKEDGLGPDAKDGCPSDDPDQDGIVGAADKCPDKPETKNDFQDDDGCPDEKPPEGPVKVTGDRIAISEEIKFKTGSADIDPASDKLVETIAKAIKDNPDVEYLEVAGHADKKGSEVSNKLLTKQRADAVSRDLIKHGVEKDRLRTAGYGSYCPIDPADTEEAYAKNRRVDFIILRRGGKDLDQKWGGCADAEKKGMKPQPLPAPKAAAKPADAGAAPKK